MQTLDALAGVARWDDAARPLRGLEGEPWPAPDTIELKNGQLVGDWGSGFRHQRLSDGLLAGFMALADASDAAVLRYARRYGVLRLCHHALPDFHDASFDVLHQRPLQGKAGMLCVGRGGPRFAESVDAWRAYAARARGLVAFALLLKDGASLDSRAARETWVTAMFGGFDTAEKAERLRAEVTDGAQRARLDTLIEDSRRDYERALRDAPTDTGVGGSMVAEEVRRWTELGRIGVELDWNGSGFSASLRPQGTPSLFGALAAQLFRAVSSSSLSLCTHCGALFQPSRKPASGRRSYCADCRQAGVPTRDSARASYRRKRAGAPQP